MAMTCGELAFKKAVAQKFGRVVTMGRTAIITRQHHGRQPCHYCGPCEQGCTTFSYFSSPWTTIADAQKTGRLSLFTDAVASHVVMQNGKAVGVAYIDRITRQPREVRGKVVLLCASTMESTRLLLNSGIGNSSGVLGHYLMDHIYGGGASGLMPGLEARPWAGPPRRPNGIYVPRFRNVTEKTTNGFIRGYGYQGGSHPGFKFHAPGIGAAYKEKVRRRVEHRTGAVGRVPGAQGELRRHRSESRGCLGHPGTRSAPIGAKTRRKFSTMDGPGRRDAARGGSDGCAIDGRPFRAGLLHPRDRHRTHGESIRRPAS